MAVAPLVLGSILVAVYQLGAQEIAVVGHHGCGMTGLNCGTILDAARKRGIDDSVITTLQHAGIDLARLRRHYDDQQFGAEGRIVGRATILEFVKSKTLTGCPRE